MILTGSIGALPPSGVSRVMWTPVTLAGGSITPGSGSSQKPNAAIMAGGCLLFGGEIAKRWRDRAVITAGSTEIQARRAIFRNRLTAAP